MPQKSQNTEAQSISEDPKLLQGPLEQSRYQWAYLTIGKQCLVGIDSPHGTLENILHREVASQPQTSQTATSAPATERARKPCTEAA
jgi:hypothetical protein